MSLLPILFISSIQMLGYRLSGIVTVQCVLYLKVYPSDSPKLKAMVRIRAMFVHPIPKVY